MIFKFLVLTLLAGCRFLQNQGTEETATKSFRSLSQAEKLKVLEEVLAQFVQDVKETRIKREKDLDFTLGHRVTLGVGLQDVPNAPAVIRLDNLDKVVADTIEVLRCQARKINPDGEDITVSNSGGTTVSFESLLQSPNAHGYIKCNRVYGKIRDDGSLLDFGAENGAAYYYYFRPCFDNYGLLTKRTAGEDARQCGKDKIESAEEKNGESLALVFKYCQKKPQICSNMISFSQKITLNQGVTDLPTELFLEREKIIATIKSLLHQFYAEAGEAIEKAVSQDDFAQLADKAKSIAGDRLLDDAESYTNYLSSAGENPYVTSEAEKKLSPWVGVISGIASDIEENATALSYSGNDCHKDFKAGEEEFKANFPDTEYSDPFAYLNYGTCVAGNVDKISRTIEMGKEEKLSEGEIGLRVASMAVDMIPLDNSRLNNMYSGAALGHALLGIFLQENDYIREFCQVCVDNVAKMRHFYGRYHVERNKFILINQRIARELTAKGVKDPYAE